jgi:hypothetical protein
MNLKEVHKAIGKIRGQLFKRSNGHNVGILKSQFRGTGLQFKEHRVYTHGDDVRFIDWKMVAKTSNPYIKTFEEERNVEIAVVLDATSSMYYGHNGVSKFQSILEITCLLYLLAKETSDFVHVVIVGRDIINVPKNSGEKGIAQLFLILSREGILDDSGKIDLSYQYNKFEGSDFDALLMKHISRNREIIILSGWGNLFNKMSFEKVLHQKRTHSFRILAPLDMGKVQNITIKGVDTVSRKTKVKTVGTIQNTNEANKLKRVKDIHLDGDYLDEFIKEMV